MPAFKSETIKKVYKVVHRFKNLSIRIRLVGTYLNHIKMNDSRNEEYVLIDMLLQSLKYTNGDKILLTIIIPILFIIGVFGNVFVIAVFVRLKSMRTAPYVYLFTLAVVDLAFLVFVAPVQWIMYASSPYREDFSGLGVVLCKFYMWIQDFCVLFSSVIFICVTFERYIAICHPMSLDTSKVTKRSQLACIVTSIVIGIYKIPIFKFSTLAGIPILRQMNNNITSQFSNFPDSYKVCVYCDGIELGTKCDRLNMTLYFDLVINVIILPCVSTLYMLILVRLCKRKNISDTADSSLHLRQMKIQSALMIVLVLLVFMICTVPLRIFSLVYNLLANNQDKALVTEETMSLIIYINRSLIFFNSAVNPVIYHMVSSRYRSAFKKGLLCRGPIKSYSKSSKTRETKLSISSRGRQTIKSDEHNKVLINQ